MNAATNPFATRFVSPGCIPYFFQSSSDLQHVLNAGDTAQWQAQIVGPHGSGKTTLVHHLASYLQSRFDSIEYLIVRGHLSVQRCQSFPANSVIPSPQLENLYRDSNRRLLVIDGVERLSWLQRSLLRSDCHRRKMGLIVTTHRRLNWLPVIFETSIDHLRFHKILDHLGVDACENDFSTLTKLHHGNCREMLFDLYDRYGHDSVP